MSGQYDIAYNIPGMQYTPGVPVMVCDGNLLRDNVNGFFLVQLKLQNIYHKILNGIDVRIQVYDNAGNPIETKTYRYEGLRVARDQYAGGDVAVPLNDSRCAGFSVKVTGVLIADGMYIQADSSAEPMTFETKELKDIWQNDPEMLKQYRLEYGREHATAAFEFADHWVCSCGIVNFRNETTCHKCGCSKDAVLHPDLTKLAKDKKTRIAQEQADKARAKARTKRIGIIGGAIALAAIILIVLVTQVFIPEKNYRAAEQLYADGKYSQAYESFYKLDDYKDSKALLGKARDAYWQKVYNDILQGKVNREISEDLYGMDPAVFASSDTKFSIADIDGDSIPELFVDIEGEACVFSVIEDYGALYGPTNQMWMYVGDDEEVYYCKNPSYIYYEYYDDDGLLQVYWMPYPEGSNTSFNVYEEESYWDDETYMTYLISDGEDSYETDEDDFYETLNSIIPEDTELQSLDFYSNSKENRGKIIAK